MGALLARGMCGKHYQRWKKWGDPTFTDNRWKQDETTRFWSHVTKTDTCWIWTGGLSHGYGSFHRQEGDKRQQVIAHIYAYESLVGPVPEGLGLDHLCHTRAKTECVGGDACPHRACVRPDHLEPVTQKINTNRGINRNVLKTHCKRGHEFTPGNTRVIPVSDRLPNGGRSCLECERMHQLKRKPPTGKPNPVLANIGKTHCKRGHEFTEENTYRIPPNERMPRGGRSCRQCQREKVARQRAAKKLLSL